MGQPGVGEARKSTYSHLPFLSLIFVGCALVAVAWGTDRWFKLKSKDGFAAEDVGWGNIDGNNLQCSITSCALAIIIPILEMIILISATITAKIAMVFSLDEMGVKVKWGWIVCSSFSLVAWLATEVMPTGMKLGSSSNQIKIDKTTRDASYYCLFFSFVSFVCAGVFLAMFRRWKCERDKCSSDKTQ